MTSEEIKKKVTEAFDSTGYISDLQVEVIGEPPKEYWVTVSSMYEYISLNLKILKALAKIFKTEDFGVNNWASGGCETCDYGSKYTHEFTIPAAK